MTDSTPWHEDDEFWHTFGPILFTEARIGSAAEQVEQALALLNVGPGAAILDLCCGVGRHSLELARRGFRVTGVDRSAAYLDTAKGRAASEGLSIEFVLEDMRRFRRPGAFDAVINLFTSFGYFEDQADDRMVLENVHASLKPGGTFVADVVGKEVLARIFRERDWQEFDDGTILLEERRVERNWSWIENRWIVLKDAQRREFRLSHRLYSAAELVALLESCGFSTVNVYGHLSGIPYDQNAKRLVAVARKA